MSYRYYIPHRNPVAFWMMDDTSPYQEHGGLGYVANTKSGASAATTSVPLVAGAAFSSVFSNTKQGEFNSPLFQVGHEQRRFALEAWVLTIPKTTQAEQQILGNLGQMDGLTISGSIIYFVNKFAGGVAEARCSYDMGVIGAAHVVGVHTDEGLQLFVNGVLVSSVEFTDAQKEATFAGSDGKLYCGATTSNQEIAVNGIAIYSNITPENILQNFAAGRKVVPQAQVGPQRDGITFNMNADAGSKYLDVTFATDADFKTGVINSVAINQDIVGPEYLNGTSVAGSITFGVSLDDTGATSIYGVMVEWSGVGITVDTSLDGTTWASQTNGALVAAITSGYNPTGKDLQIRVNFSGGLTTDPSLLDSLHVVGFLNNTFASSEVRSITVGWPAVLRSDYEPILYRDDNGVSLRGQTLTIGPDTTSAPVASRTLEVWIKPLSGTVTFSTTGTVYRNGVVDSTLPIGEWSLVHIVAGADITGNITISGNCIVGQTTIYPTALTASDVAYLYASYTGVPVLSFVDSAGITIAEQSPNPLSLYSKNWAVTGGG